MVLTNQDYYEELKQGAKVQVAVIPENKNKSVVVYDGLLEEYEFDKRMSEWRVTTVFNEGTKINVTSIYNGGVKPDTTSAFLSKADGGIAGLELTQQSPEAIYRRLHMTNRPKPDQCITYGGVHRCLKELEQ